MSNATSTQMHANAARHAQLIAALTEHDYAPASLIQQTNHLTHLRTELQAAITSIANLTTVTAKERKEYEALRDSTSAQLKAKLKGRVGIGEYKAKLEKEEKEYLSALEEVYVATSQKEALEQQIAAAEKTNAELQATAFRHATAQAQLDELYASIFSGPTPEFPEEDDLEQALRDAKTRHDEVQTRLASESHASALLSQAETALGKCRHSLEEAFKSTSVPVLGGGAGTAHILELTAVTSAQSEAARAMSLFTQARSSCSSVQDIVSGGGVIDVLKERAYPWYNPIGDRVYREKIQASQKEVQEALERLKSESAAAKKRAEAVGEEMAQAAKNLNNGREALLSTRRKAFSSIVDSAGPSSSPPLYGPGLPSSDPPPSWASLNPYAASLIDQGM